MQRIRSEFQFDRDLDAAPTAFATEKNRFKFRCGMCGGPMFVDRALKNKLEKAREEGLEENPLVCDECERDFQEDERPA
ncbi:MAG: hypothetical protein J5I65_10560 [Aridibacter famidurans]|nr:hypothetical protein [Aridibacter famidurans]